MGRVIAIANQKGGVGKTTTAVNLGASLAASERSVLICDLDPQGNATSGLGHATQSVDKSTYEVLMGTRSLKDVVLETPLPHLHLAPANADLTGAELELVESENREYRLRQALSAERHLYSFILVDCPPSLGLLTLNALTAADAVLVPLQCEYYAMEGLGRLLGTIERVKAAFNPNLSLEGILLCMYDPRTNLTRQVADEVRRHFPDGVFETVIPRNIRLGESPSFGKPVLLYDIQSIGSQSYLKLAQEFLDRAAVRTQLHREHHP